MRFPSILLTLLFLIPLVPVQAEEQIKLDTPVEEDSETRVYEVFGMDCPGCHGGLEKLVEKISSLQEADANWIEQRLVVTVAPGNDLEDEVVYDAIKRANFTPGKRTK
ncbi:MAG: hypothetical protein QF371_10050 [Flavobacteriales bacterium]|nr:hypothetical protein [Flavobacteriales bacterium]